MYVILHAFSRRNSGDGLLVDLTLEALEAAGIDREDCVLLALDPESFDQDDISVARAPGEPSAQVTPKLGFAALEVLVSAVTGARFGRVAKVTSGAKGLIAVGGGYLVADRFVRQAGVLLNHFAQLSSAAKAGVPTIYLPQSIGPMKGTVGRLAKSRLTQMDRIYVRDDLTMSEMGSANARRIGDLAVMKLGREIEAIEPIAPAGKTILIARDLPADGDYTTRLQKLAASVSDPVWAVQADTQGPRSDRAFYQRLGYDDGGSMSDLMAQGTPGVVISVRLHGAIAALLAGRPSIHLAYERKGWGAYEDLGIAEFVHDARTFDPERVAAQAKELQSDPSNFWNRIRAAAPALERQYNDMVSDLRERLLGPSATPK
ncbi:MAG: polysaccharide pyruvyl transferase family protein [Pseudomonadota bacterium]